MRYGEGPCGAPFYIGRRSRLGGVDFAGIGIDGEAGFLSELLSAARSGVFQAIGVAIHLQDMNVVGQPVEQRAGQPLGPEHAGPFFEWQVGGDDRRAALMALAEDLEQQLRSGLRKRHVAQFVNDQQLCGGEVLLQSQQAALVARLLELMDEAGSGGEGNREPPLTGSKPQGQGNMGLPGTAVAENDNVVAGEDELAAHQLQDQRLVEGGHCRKIEGVQAFYRREAGVADAPLNQAALAVDQLQFGQAQQVSGMIDALAGTVTGDLLVLAQESRQLERFQVMRQQHLRRRGAHAALRDNRAA
jgi:hypothetical protein